MQSFFNGLSGMFNFSKTLDNVSNNISNMNTPGYRGSDVFMRSLSDGESSYGSVVTSTSMRMQPGDIRQTSNDTDLAINGDGYFVLQNSEGELFYTRAGQFKFDADNKLVDGASGYSVMAINSYGQLNAIDITDKKLLPPKATTGVNLSGNLSTSSSPYTVNNINVYDAIGASHKLSAVFTNSATNTWDVVINDDSPAQVATFQIQFGADASPLTGFNSVTKSLTLGASAQNITFNIGNTGSLAGSTQLSGISDLKAAATDGHDAIGLKSLSIDAKGIIQLKYSGSETASGQQVALANFSDPSALASSSKGLFKSDSTTKPLYGKPDAGVFGTIQNKSIEMSNVDLTQEFADILIIQRGYQASSRVMSVANDLLDQLYNSTRTK